jgi:hypothetical protein
MQPEVIGVFIPILLGLGAFAMVFGLRYLRNKENMAMIEKGMDPKLNQKSPSPFSNLKWGLLLVGSGIGLFTAYMIDRFGMSGSGDFHHHNGEEAIYFALIGIGGGIGLIMSYKIEKKEVLDKNDKN